MLSLCSAVDGKCTNVPHAILLWIVLALCYHTFVFLLTGGWKDFIKSGPTCSAIASTAKITCPPCPLEQTACRIARYYKCKKRAKRRDRGASPCRMFESYFNALQMPSPLPYHRRRRTEKQCQSEDSTSGPVQDTDVAVAEPLSDDSSSSIDTQVSVQKPKDDAVQKSTKRRKPKRRSPSQTPLIDLARMQHWPLLVKRASKHKKEAEHQDADGLLPLHWAVSGGPPLEVVESLLQAHPEGAIAVDYEGSTALHFACHYGANAAVVEFLLTVNGDASRKQDKHGRSPLYHAVDKQASLDVVRYLVRADPSMITKPCLPRDEKLARKVRARDERPLHHRTPLFMAWAQVMMDRQTRDRHTGRLWEKAEILLQGAYAYHSSQRIYRMVHATVTLDEYLPQEIIDVAIKLFPEQLSEKEENTGRVPLAIAAAMHQLLMSRSQEMIRLLLHAHPKAARISDHQGRTPLSLATASGKSWTAGVEDLFHAAPELIKWTDGSSKTYPALVSASSTPAEETKCVAKSCRVYSTFQLLQDEKTADSQKHALRAQHEEDVCAWKGADSDLRHLSTVFELILADPSIMK